MRVQFLPGAQGRKSKLLCFFVHLRQAQRCFVSTRNCESGSRKFASGGEQIIRDHKTRKSVLGRDCRVTNLKNRSSHQEARASTHQANRSQERLCAIGTQAMLLWCKPRKSPKAGNHSCSYPKEGKLPPTPTQLGERVLPIPGPPA